MVSKKPWSPAEAARLFLTILLTLFVGLFVAGLADARKPGWSHETRDFADMVIMTVFLHGGAMGWIGLFLWQQALTWREAFFAGGQGWKAAGIGLAVGAVSAPALVLLQDGLTVVAKKYLHWNLEAEELVQKLGSPHISEAAKIFIGVTAIVVAPVAEEVIFRGMLYPTVKQIGFPRAALFGTSILFALAHGSAMAFVPLALFSMILIWLYEWRDNLVAPMMAHCALNALNYYWIVAAPAAVSAAAGH